MTWLRLQLAFELGRPDVVELEQGETVEVLELGTTTELELEEDEPERPPMGFGR